MHSLQARLQALSAEAGLLARRVAGRVLRGLIRLAGLIRVRRGVGSRRVAAGRVVLRRVAIWRRSSRHGGAAIPCTGGTCFTLRCLSKS